MTTVIVTGLPALAANITYHRRLARYMLELSGEGVTVEFVLTGKQLTKLLADLSQEEKKLTSPSNAPSPSGTVSE